MKELGKRLRVLRESVGLSQAKLAQEIGSNQSSINRYENSPLLHFFTSRKQCMCGHKPYCDKSRKQCLWRAICEKRSFPLWRI